MAFTRFAVTDNVIFWQFQEVIAQDIAEKNNVPRTFHQKSLEYIAITSSLFEHVSKYSGNIQNLCRRHMTENLFSVALNHNHPLTHSRTSVYIRRDSNIGYMNDCNQSAFRYLYTFFVLVLKQYFECEVSIKCTMVIVTKKTI